MALTVSVALCTRNGARYLRQQIESICAQDLKPCELVLSDDASSDDSVALVEQLLAPSGIPLRVLRNDPPLGVTRNFEQAVRACGGDLVALCDHDDVWHPGRLARMAAPFEARPDLLLLHSDARMVDADGAPLGTTLFQTLEVQPRELAAIARGDAFDVLLRRNLVTGAATVFRRRLLEAALPFPATWVHDEWLAAIAAAIGRVDVLPEPLIDYRQHGANQIGARRLGLAEKLAKAFDTRGDKHAQRLARAQALLERLQALGARVPPARLQAQQQKVAHQAFRAALPAARLARLPRVLREAASGRYQRFGRGKQAVVQDLFERG